MRSLRARSWDRYNNAKERRFMERTAKAAEPRTCEDCGGRGVDPGSLYQAEECPSCCGSGVILPPDRAARRQPGTATTALPDTVSPTAAGRTKP